MKRYLTTLLAIILFEEYNIDWLTIGPATLLTLIMLT